MFIRGNTDILRVNVATAADIEINLDVLEVDASTPPVVQPVPNFGPQASITGTGLTTLVDATGLSAGEAYRVTRCAIYNNHATDASVVRVERNDGTNTAIEAQVNLLAGEKLIYNEGDWDHQDASGGSYPSMAGLVAATQAEQEAGTATNRYVAPATQQFHPSAAKVWVKQTPGANNLASYNVTSVADTSAGIAVITIATDFSSANWVCQATVESTSDTMTVTNLKFVRIGLGDQAAGSVSIEAHDGTATTAVMEDPTAWHMLGFGDQ